MSAAAPHIAQGTPDARRLGVALGALTLAVALLVGVAITQQAARSGSAPASSQARELLINLPTGGGLRYTGIPYLPRTDAAAGGTRSTVIPYQARSRSGGRVIDHAGSGTLYTGIPYAPSARPSTGVPAGTFSPK